MGQWLIKLFQRVGHLVIIIHILCFILILNPDIVSANFSSSTFIIWVTKNV